MNFALLTLILCVLLLWSLPPMKRPRRILIIALCVGGSWTLYLFQGHPQQKDIPARLLTPTPNANVLAPLQRRLQSYLQKNPRDCEGWRHLWQLYEGQGQVKIAAEVHKYYKGLCQENTPRPFLKG